MCHSPNGTIVIFLQSNVDVFSIWCSYRKLMFEHVDRNEIVVPVSAKEWCFVVNGCGVVVASVP